jgi:hypothetical protein
MTESWHDGGFSRKGAEERGLLENSEGTGLLMTEDGDGWFRTRHSFRRVGRKGERPVQELWWAIGTVVETQ